MWSVMLVYLIAIFVGGFIGFFTYSYDNRKEKRINEQIPILKKEDVEINQKYIQTMIKNNLFLVIYPRDGNKETAERIARAIDSTIGIAQFIDENGNSIWGVLIDKVKEAQKQMKMKMKREENNDNNV